MSDAKGKLQSRPVIRDDKASEAARVFEGLGPIKEITSNSGRGKITGPVVVTDYGAVVVPLGIVHDEGVIPTMINERKIIRGYNPQALEHNLSARKLFPHILNQVLRQRHWDVVFDNVYADGLVLDVGCGYGDHFQVLKGAEKRRVVAFDYMKQFLQEVERRHREITVARGDWTDTGFKDATFEAVSGFNAISNTHSRDELEKVIREFDRILKPGPDGAKRMFFITNMDPLPDDWYPGDYHFASRGLIHLEPGTQEWYLARSPLCRESRSNFIDATRRALERLGYQVEVDVHTGQDLAKAYFPKKGASREQKQVMERTPTANTFIHTAALGVSFLADEKVPRDQVVEGMEYYSFHAKKEQGI